MHRNILVGRGHPRRDSAERFIKETFAFEYGARLDSFPSHLIALLDPRDEILCAAGLRFVGDGFFSERYLNTPIEVAVSSLSCRSVDRNAIFEVTTLASRSPQATAGFISAIGEFGETDGFEWSFFTLTRRFHLMVKRMGVALVFLADADQARIAESARWGSYYASQPKVWAGASRKLAKPQNNVEMERCREVAV